MKRTTEKAIKQLTVQAKNGPGGHPDIAIRNFNRALVRTYRKNARVRKFIDRVAVSRKDLSPTHFADLIARAVQHRLRQRDVANYKNYSIIEWLDFWRKVTDEELGLLQQILETRSVATHVLERYRGLAVISSMIENHRGIRVCDWGCSLNLGLPAIIRPRHLLNGAGTRELTDFTPGNVVERALEKDNIHFDKAVGVDRQSPDFEWVASCSYFSQYEITRNLLSQLRNSLSGLLTVTETIVGDVTGENIIDSHSVLSAGNFDLVHASMMMYQLSDKHKRRALENASTLLRDGGIFMELTFINPANWFLKKNVVSRVQFKKNGKLGKPLDWIVWSSSRCEEVYPGKDFEKVQKMLEE